MKIIEDTSARIETVDSFLEEDEKVKIISLLSNLSVGQLRKTIIKIGYLCKKQFELFNTIA